uniref:Uncharacterized protein n=1 Tax=Oryza punctata TaxID=4537 RepID=A0A0E0K4C0_ORYPU
MSGIAGQSSERHLQVRTPDESYLESRKTMPIQQASQKGPREGISLIQTLFRTNSTSVEIDLVCFFWEKPVNT